MTTPQQPSTPSTGQPPRIPFWWTGERISLGSEAEVAEGEENGATDRPVPPCQHPHPLQVSNCFDELVARLCPDCDAQLPIADDVPTSNEPTSNEPAHTDADRYPKPDQPRSAKSSKIANPRLRWLAFNATAAGAGHLTIWSLAGDPMAGVTYIARMAISVPQIAAAAVTLGAAVVAWKAARLIGLHQLPGLLGSFARPVAALAAAAWGQGTAPLINDLVTLTHPWSTLLAPLLAVGPLAAACWWGLDRNVMGARMPLRWAARIPLATIVLSSALYAPGELT